MKKMKKNMILTILFPAIFLSFNTVAYADNEIIEQQMNALQPYIDELNSINNELNLELCFSLSTPEEISVVYEEYSSMSIEKFRNCIIDSYYTYKNSANCTDIEENAGISTHADVTHPQSQKIYQLSGNYYLLDSTVTRKNGKYVYVSIDGFEEHVSNYPAYKFTNYNSKISRDGTYATITIYYYEYIREGVLLTSTEKNTQVNIYPTDSFVYLPDTSTEI